MADATFYSLGSEKNKVLDIEHDAGGLGKRKKQGCMQAEAFPMWSIAIATCDVGGHLSLVCGYAPCRDAANYLRADGPCLFTGVWCHSDG